VVKKVGFIWGFGRLALFGFELGLFFARLMAVSLLYSFVRPTFACILPILKLGLFCIIGPICRGFSTIVERCPSWGSRNPKSETRNPPQDTLWWKQIQRGNDRNTKHIVSPLRRTSYGCSKEDCSVGFPQFYFTVLSFYLLGIHYTSCEVGCQVKFCTGEGDEGSGTGEVGGKREKGEGKSEKGKGRSEKGKGKREK